VSPQDQNLQLLARIVVLQGIVAALLRRNTRSQDGRLKTAREIDQWAEGIDQTTYPELPPEDAARFASALSEAAKSMTSFFKNRVWEE